MCQNVTFYTPSFFLKSKHNALSENHFARLCLPIDSHPQHVDAIRQVTAIDSHFRHIRRHPHRAQNAATHVQQVQNHLCMDVFNRHNHIIVCWIGRNSHLRTAKLLNSSQHRLIQRNDAVAAVHCGQILCISAGRVRVEAILRIGLACCDAVRDVILYTGFNVRVKV